MRPTLAEWVSRGDAFHYCGLLKLPSMPEELSDLGRRSADYFVSLVGELFARIREPYEAQEDWSRLGNALTQSAVIQGSIAPNTQSLQLPTDTALLAAAAFYIGGYPASAYLTLKAADPASLSGAGLSSYELLARPAEIQSEIVARLLAGLRQGDQQTVEAIRGEASERAAGAVERGPEEWVSWTLLRQIVERFEKTNIRAVLPDGYDEFWNPLVRSFLNQVPPVWDFFPSQVEAIQKGLLDSSITYSLQMPTGAGKTALSETLLFFIYRMYREGNRLTVAAPAGSV